MRQSRFSVFGWLVVASLMLTACETTVEVELPDHPDLLMMNSFFSDDFSFEVWLGEAVSVVSGEDAIDCVPNGTVELWEGTRLVEELPHVGDCLYKSPANRPVHGVEYTIKASAPGFNPIEATDASPMPVDASFAYQIIPGDAQSGRVDVDITFSDPPDVDNWYRIMVLYRITFETGTWLYDPGYTSDYEPIVVENGILFDDERYETVYFSDTRMPAGEQTIELDIDRWLEGVEGEVDIIVIFDGVSQNFHDYATTLLLQEDIGDNPFGEPVQISTNVKDGYGIFGGFDRNELDVRVR